ncbi:DNA gyrase subunit A [Telmatospirillum siberiense]|uniref:DNA gyrase subunit A n=1 Tax=Telmatospirillum siberiense TaxID=382514 RepID=A0A2N3PSA8_9PROT|nr:DNA gyrase subunit A [Telmatospirillum siberiense]PKU23264.1 DNA gyrase subunit A [Telmatospirillum siberiense]
MTTPPTSLPFDITPVTIEEEMKRSYLDYAMSVIVSRALPDVRDGLKPVHRRILFSMKESGYDFNKPFRKSARIVGDVMGKYHPHGDSAIYDAMVRMAQDFSMRLQLIDGQGNFGSMDGDPPAAMRYTEARLARAAASLLDDIDKETVNFQSNYDDTTHEPMVLPARFPNLLVNGAGGIAVGMATNIPPHNLGEVIDACCAYIDNPNITIEELMQIVEAPDFPTGGIILGRSGIRAAFTTGRGSVILRGRCHFEEVRKDRTAIIVTEIPYQVNKSRMIEQMAELVRDKRIEGISDLRDESDRDGVRVVIEIKRDAVPDVVLNQLYRYTPLQSSFGVNMLALNGGRPQMMPLRDVIVAFVAFRDEVITRRTIFELGKARDRAHVLVGLAIAVANLDPVIKLIRAAADPNTAREQLMARDWPAHDVEPLIVLIDEPGHGVVDGHYRLSETQARAILDLRLHRLTGLERDKIHSELTEIGEQIREFLHILSSRERLYEILREELVEMKTQFATPRRTSIEENEFEADIEDLIAREDMVVTVTNTGYIKRVPLSEYRTQRRGGKGRSGMSIREEDFVTQVFVANTHTPIIFFSSTGIAYKMKVYKLPLGNPQARGKAMVNLLPLDQDETITTVMPLPEDEAGWADLHVMFATASGYVRRNLLSDFTDIRANGKIAMKLDEGDRLIAVQTCTEQDDVLLAAHNGKCIRFPVTDVRVFKGRDSTGVRGIRLEDGDEVISMSTLSHVEFDSETRDSYLRGDLPAEDQERLALLEQHILSISVNGFGKRTSAYEYRITGRGGSGIANIDLTEKTGPVIASFPVLHSDEIMLVTNAGKLIRIPVDGVRIAGRKTQGVMLLRTADDESVVSVARLGDVGGNGDDADGGDEGDDDAVEPDEKDAQGEA